MKRPGEVQKQEGDTDKEYKCKYDTDLSFLGKSSYLAGHFYKR